MSKPTCVQVFGDVDGVLGVLEFAGIPFVPRRFFWLSEVPANQIRADHAHRTCEQFLVCICGKLNAEVTGRGNSTRTIQLTRGESLYLEPLEWLRLSDFDDGTVLGVFASEPYDPDEYIESFDELSRIWSQSLKD
jgi:UDP-2-acetamido-3-amino-2,3-dideoxy-glucuronate N-acetyltransferase